MSGQHRADSEKVILGQVLENVREQRSALLSLQRDLEWNVRKLEVMGDWNSDVGNAVVVFTHVAPPAISDLVDKYSRAIDALQTVYDVL